MKLFHISDLHIGIRIHEKPILEDQRYILNQILSLCISERSDALIIAGDIYDKSIPGAEAVSMFDEFLTALRDNKIPVFAISGNHDSAERVAYASRIMAENDIFMSPVYGGHTEPVVLRDEYGEVNFYMLPFIKPQAVRRFFDTEITSYDDAVRAAVDKMEIDKSKRNVIIAHQFVTGAKTSDSDMSLGGMDNISADIFADFDYAALGHIHRPQRISSDYIRYSGTPMKYSFSECADKKAVQVAELTEKGTVKLSSLPLTPMYDMREIKGTYDELTARSFYENTNTDEYLHITLTDSEDIPYAFEKLQTIYKNILRLDYDNARTRLASGAAIAPIDEQSAEDMFASLYEKQNGEPLSEEQIKAVVKFIEETREGE